MRSGRSRKRGADEIGQRGRAVLGAQRHEIGRGALQLARILDQHDAVAGLGDLGEQRIDQRGLAGRGAAGDEDVLPFPDGRPQQLGLRAGHDAGLDIIAEREDGDGGAADGEARRRHDGRHQALEPLPAFRQFGRDARRAGMHLDADMVRDEPHDPLGVGGRHPTAGILQPARQPVDPEPAVGIEHHLDDARVFEIARDCRSERGAQHARAAGKGFGPERDWRHIEPHEIASSRRIDQRG